jgi:hypothetical protein
MEQPSPSQALERLAPLIGTWRMEAGAPGEPPWPGEAWVSFEWLDGRAFLVERWHVDLPEAPDGIAIIGPDESGERFRQHYFDSRGVERVYEMSFSDGVWRLWRDGEDFSQRFSGTLSGDGGTISGRWEIAHDGTTWETDFDLAYIKVDQ